MKDKFILAFNVVLATLGVGVLLSLVFFLVWFVGDWSTRGISSQLGNETYMAYTNSSSVCNSSYTCLNKN